MLLPRILAPVRASLQASVKLAAPSTHVLDTLRAVNAAACPPTITLCFTRHASHQSQGRANGAKDGPGKRLGAKKSGGEYVIPGNIIFRQRGTSWFPGENCKFGRDHCIFATESGYVRYYRDPRRHPKRQYIGVALDKAHSLPYPAQAPRRRRLNMVAVAVEPVKEVGMEMEVVAADATGEQVKLAKEGRENRVLVSGKGHTYREANWQIGRAAERANVEVKQFVPGDRWTAWKKSAARKEASEAKKRLRNAGKKGTRKTKR